MLAAGGNHEIANLVVVVSHGHDKRISRAAAAGRRTGELEVIEDFDSWIARDQRLDQPAVDLAVQRHEGLEFCSHGCAPMGFEVGVA